MKKKEIERVSIFLCLILRHKPEEIGIVLDENGWADIDDLIFGMQSRGRNLDRPLLDEIVRTDEKRRYVFSPDGRKIRACQGHSVPVDMQFKVEVPPALLYHGTAKHLLPVIHREGLNPQKRQYVHLSTNKETAIKVGSRHGDPSVITISAGEMHESGVTFYLSENGVWLVSHVPPEYFR